MNSNATSQQAGGLAMLKLHSFKPVHSLLQTKDITSAPVQPCPYECDCVPITHPVTEHILTS
jgi:hypothetical protein